LAPWAEAAGGGWNDAAPTDAAGFVVRYDAQARGADLGFRCARSLPEVREAPRSEPERAVVSARDGARLVLVAGGVHSVGGLPVGKRATPRLDVELRPFYVDESPVTNASFAGYLKANGLAPSPGLAERIEKTPEAPAEVAWKDASAYAAWAGRRLPSEAEW